MIAGIKATNRIQSDLGELIFLLPHGWDYALSVALSADSGPVLLDCPRAATDGAS